MFLRFLGTANTAIWLGAAVFFTAGVEPGFFSGEMLSLFGGGPAGQAYGEAAAEMIRESYFTLQYWCAGVALAQLIAEWLYSGRPLRRWLVYWVVGLLALSLFEGEYIAPKLHQLNLDRYGRLSTAVQRERGQKLFGSWHAAFDFASALVCCGLVVYLWQTTSSGNPSRFASANKFRG